VRALDRYRGKDMSETETLQPSPTHIRTGEFLDELFATMLGSSSAMGPIVKMMHRAKPALLRDMMTIPEPQLQQFLFDLGSRMVKASGVIDPEKAALQAEVEALEDQIDDEYDTGYRAMVEYQNRGINGVVVTPPDVVISGPVENLPAST
jgi:hypothetical protein